MKGQPERRCLALAHRGDLIGLIQERPANFLGNRIDVPVQQLVDLPVDAAKDAYGQVRFDGQTHVLDVLPKGVDPDLHRLVLAPCQ